MQPIAYTISPYLIRTIQTVENLRREILLLPLPPKREVLFRFDAMVSRVTNGMFLEGTQVAENDIRNLLQNRLFLAAAQKLDTIPARSIGYSILYYKEAFDYISEEWLASQNTVRVKDCINLFNILSNRSKLQIPELTLKSLLDYVQTSNQHTIIQAAIIKFQTKQLTPFLEKNELFSTLLSYLFLYKGGMDFRGLLVLEKKWAEKQNEYSAFYTNAIHRSHITGWLEYYAETIRDNLLMVWDNLQKPVGIPPESVINLNDRQKKILRLMDTPDKMITNRDVQKIFKISQITASRDLAKLAAWGFLFAHGKGRSVKYTKA